MSPKSLPPDRLAVLLMLGLCASWGLNQVAAGIVLVNWPMRRSDVQPGGD
jgi:hypothetical protein